MTRRPAPATVLPRAPTAARAGRRCRQDRPRVLADASRAQTVEPESPAQTHYGLWTEWARATGNAHPVNVRRRHLWLGTRALPRGVAVQAIWALYAVGFGLLPRQFTQEAMAHRRMGVRKQGFILSILRQGGRGKSSHAVGVALTY